MIKVWIVVVLVPALSFADSSLIAKRDKVVKRVNQDMQSRDPMSYCGRLAADAETLTEIYQQGEKSVLPTLLRVRSSGKSLPCEHLADYRVTLELGIQGPINELRNEVNHTIENRPISPTAPVNPDKHEKAIASAFVRLEEFYRESLLKDPGDFLAAMGQMPSQDQRVIAFSIAGGLLGLEKDSYDGVEAALRNIPESDLTKPIAQMCLETLRKVNAPFVEAYFPPNAFNPQNTEQQVREYTVAMYRLGEKPLWPPSAGSATMYRLTYMPHGIMMLPHGPVSVPAFLGPTVIALLVPANGNGTIEIRTSYRTREGKITNVDETRAVTRDQLALFVAQLEGSNFWTTTTELPRRGVSGADWVMEGAKDGTYRTVVRQCPDLEHQSIEEAQFAKAGRLLFEMAGHKWDVEFDLHCTNSQPAFSPESGDPSCPTCLSGP